MTVACVELKPGSPAIFVVIFERMRDTESPVAASVPVSVMF